MDDKIAVYPFISTTLHRPPVPDGHIHRPELFNTLDKGRCSLTPVFLFFFVLIMILLLSAPLSAWTEETSEIALPDDERALLKANPEKEAKAESVTIQLRWFHQFQFAGYYAAVEKGFYAEEGLDVSLLEFNPGEGRVAAVLAGKAQYGVGDPVLLKLREEGKPLVVLAQIFQHTPQVLITKRESGLLDPENLAGKRVMVTRDDMGSAPIQAMLLETLGGLDSVEFVTHSHRFEDLIEGSVDAISAYRSNEPFRMKQQGVDVNIIEPRSYGIDFYGDNLFTTDQELKEHHGRAEKVVRATLKGWKYALKHKDEIIQLIRQTYAPALSVDQLRYEAKVIDQMIVPDLIDLGDINPKRYQHIAETYHRLGMLKEAEIPAGFLHGPREHMVDLTPEEQVWLAEHPDITLGFADQYEPFLIKGADGNLSGILIDFLNLINGRLGTKFKPECAPWGEILEKVERRKLAGTLTMTPTAADARGLLKTETQFNIYPAIFARSDAPFSINGLDDLRGRSLAIIDPSHFSEKILESLGSEVDIKRVPDGVKIMQMVYEGEVDAALTVTSHNYIIAKFGFSAVRPVYTFWDQPIRSLMGVRPDWPELVSILNKGIASLSQGEINALLVKWINAPVESSPSLMFTEAEKAWLEGNPELGSLALQLRARVRLSATEREWLATKPKVLIRTGDYPPFHFDVDGIPDGLAIDYVKAICMAQNLDCNFVTGMTVEESTHSMQQSGGVAIQPAWQKSAKREEVALFTGPYVTSPFVIFQRRDSECALSMDDLAGKRVVVEKNYAIHNLLRNRFPDLQLVEVEFSTEALKYLVEGRADAYVSNLMVGYYLSLAHGFPNVVVTAPTPFEPNILEIAVRKDWPELASIITKSIAAIQPEEHQNFRQRWLSVEYQKEVDYTLLWQILAGMGLVFLFIVLWNKQLIRKVKERTSQLSESESRFRATFEQAAVGVTHVSLEGKFLRINQKFCDIVGYSGDELLERTFMDLTHPDDLEADLEYVQQVINGKRENYSIEKRYFHKYGSIIWVNLTVSLLFDKGGNPIFFVAVINDISERKEAEAELKVYQARLKALASQLIMVEEKERSRIAVELHDHIGQTLAFSRIQIAQAKKYVSEGKLATLLDEISQSLLGTIQDTKELIFDLSPPLLHEIGLAAAISNWLEEEVGRKNSIMVTFVYRGKELPLKKDLRSTVFRNVRELLTNVIKHAQATEVVVTLVANEEELVIIVRDDGIGFDYDSQADLFRSDSGFGLFSVKQQIEDFGGKLEIESSLGKGCKATLTVPTHKC